MRTRFSVKAVRKTLLAFLLLPLCALAQSNVLTGTVANYGLTPKPGVLVKLTLVSPKPRVVDGVMIQNDPVPIQSGTNGTFAFTNILWGKYTLAVGNMPTTWTVNVGTNTTGTVPIGSLADSATPVPPNPATNYYTQSQVDALIAGVESGELPDGVVTNGQSNVSFLGSNYLANAYLGPSMVITGAPATLYLQSLADGTPVQASFTMDNLGDFTITADSVNLSGDIYMNPDKSANLGTVTAGTGSFGNITSTGTISAVSFAGDGSGLTNLSTGWAGYANVRDYGAVGDGSADDSAAFVSALAANPNLYVPPGTYKVSTLYPTNGTWIRGAGPNSVLIPAGTNWVVDCLSNTVNVSDLLIDGGVTTANRSLSELGTVHGLKAWVGGDVWIRDVAVRNCSGYGVFATGIVVDSTHPDRALLSGLSVSNCYWGLRTDTGKTAEYLRFNNCLISQCYIGAQLQSPNGTFANNRITDNTYGFWFAPWTDNRSHTIVSCNTFNHNTYNLVATNCGTGLTIVGNNLLGNGTNYFSACTNLLLSANSMDQYNTVFDGCGPGLMTGNYLSTDSAVVTLSNSPMMLVYGNRDKSGDAINAPALVVRGEYYSTLNSNGAVARIVGLSAWNNRLNIGDIDTLFNGVAIWDAGAQVIYLTNGLVGIKTNSPLASLHILNAATPLRFSRAGREDWSFNQTSTSGGGLGIYNETDSAYRLFLSEAGAVTVGGGVTASNVTATAGGLTLPILPAAPAVTGNNGVLWLSNAAAPVLYISTTNGTFPH